MPNNDVILTPMHGVENFTYEDVNILLNAQRLWIELILWMRNFFHSSLENLPDLSSVTNRVFQQLPLDFYNEFSKYFGPAESRQFLDVFTKLVTTNWQLVNAYKENNQAAIDASLVQWYRNADEMASFLAGVNRYWDENLLKYMLYDYIEIKIREIIAFLAGDYELEIRIFNDLENKAAHFAAYLAMGIIARRPPPRPPAGTL